MPGARRQRDRPPGAQRQGHISTVNQPRPRPLAREHSRTQRARSPSIFPKPPSPARRAGQIEGSHWPRPTFVGGGDLTEQGPLSVDRSEPKVREPPAVCHGRRRWAILLRRGAMTRAPIAGAKTNICDRPIALRRGAPCALRVPVGADALIGWQKQAPRDYSYDASPSRLPSFSVPLRRPSFLSGNSCIFGFATPVVVVSSQCAGRFRGRVKVVARDFARHATQEQAAAAADRFVRFDVRCSM